MKKRFLYGFLVLALITLLSGMVQANTMTNSKDEGIELSVNSPPAVLPTNVYVNITSSATVTWYCTLNPGYQFVSSVNTDIIVWADMPSMTCDIYYTIEKPDIKLQLTEGYIRQIDHYPFYRLQNQLSIHKNLATQSVPSWVYRQPRDGLRQSWQA